MKSTNNQVWQKIAKFRTKKSIPDKHRIVRTTNLREFKNFTPALLVMLEIFRRSGV